MKEFGDGFYKNNGETNNIEKKEEEVVMSEDKEKDKRKNEDDLKNWKTNWFPEKAEEIKEYGEKIKKIHFARMAKGEDPFGFSVKVNEGLMKKYSLTEINHCFISQLLNFSTPKSRENIFYDFPEPDSVREAIDKEFEKLEN